MIPRGTLDIGWDDLLIALGYCVLPYNPLQAQAEVETAWSKQGDAVACLSVRSGFDCLLQALALPAGSEVLVSAVTIPHMIEILRHHGLVPIPLDIDADTLAVDVSQLGRAIGPATKMILIAHLFGSRVALEPIAAIAQHHGLLVVEDCAQAYDASGYTGHGASDASLFSFGTIKMQTALGGGLMRVRDRSLRAKIRQLQAALPRQRRQVFAKRVARAVVLKMLSVPLCFTLFVALCHLCKRDHDQIISQATRGFTGRDLFTQLRQQPAAPLLRLLDRRLRRADPQRIIRRAAPLITIAQYVPARNRPGTATIHHTHWVLPITSRAPDVLVALLRTHGFDATRKASSLAAILPPLCRAECSTTRAQQLLEQLVYLPVSPAMGENQIARLCHVITSFEQVNESMTHIA